MESRIHFKTMIDKSFSMVNRYALKSENNGTDYRTGTAWNTEGIYSKPEHLTHWQLVILPVPFVHTSLPESLITSLAYPNDRTFYRHLECCAVLCFRLYLAIPDFPLVDKNSLTSRKYCNELKTWETFVLSVLLSILLQYFQYYICE